MLVTNVICLIAAAINVGSYFAKSHEMLIVGRFICGFYIGLYSGIIPMYLSEIAPINLRGSIGTMNQLFLVNLYFWNIIASNA
jgi:SP family facilitated glucose transporter-like MFS transporter 1